MSTPTSDTALERLLRETLSTRAEEVTSGPVRYRSEDRRRTPRRGVPKALLPLAAAAAVAAVAVTVTLRGGGANDQHPATPPASEHSSSPSQPAGPHATPTCPTRLPAAWRAAIANGTTAAGSVSAFPLFVTSDGRVVITRDFGSSRDVALLSPGGRAQSIYDVPAPNENQATEAVVEGNLALVVVSRLPRNSNGVLATVDRIVVVDLSSGTRTVVATNSEHDMIAGHRTIDGATLYRGRVYYDVRQRYAARVSAIHAYDVADRVDRVVATATGDGPGNGPTLAPQGVLWSRQPMQLGVPRALPGPVARATAGRAQAAGLVTDGRSYAWRATDHTIGYWTPGLDAARYFRAPAGVVTVSGPFVVSNGTGAAPTRLLDTRTGATAPLQGVQPYGMSAGGTLALYGVAGSKDRTTVVAVDASALPELHC